MGESIRTLDAHAAWAYRNQVPVDWGQVDLPDWSTCLAGGLQKANSKNLFAILFGLLNKALGIEIQLLNWAFGAKLPLMMDKEDETLVVIALILGAIHAADGFNVVQAFQIDMDKDDGE